MEKDLKDFLNKAKHIKLSESERGLMRGNLEEFIWKNPIKISEKKGSAFYFSFMTWRVGIAVFAFLLIAGSAGASVLATNALPGEKLYGMKVGVNEEVKTFFAFTDEAKAKANAEIAEVRLLEVEKLAEQGKLNRENREKLEQDFKNRADLFESKLKKIEQKDTIQTDTKQVEDGAGVQSEENNIKRYKIEYLKSEFEERLKVREKALEEVRQRKNEERQKGLEARELHESEDKTEENNNKEEIESEDEEGEDEVEPILKEVRGRMKRDRRD